jgi:iron complex outermembrane receptor protein
MVSVSGIAHAQQAVLEEVIVTAQKREQSLQDVPVSVTAFDGAYIDKAGIKDIRDIGGLTPGLSIKSRGDTEASVFIRGIGSQAPGIGADPAVGIFIDGVSASRATNATAAFFDVERVEVVKGPQGTLFGRNASAGAISIITRRPDLEASDVSVLIGAGDKGQLKYQAIGNFAASDKFALRLGVNHYERDGLYRNSVTGQDLLNADTTNIRLGALLLPNDYWQSYLSVERIDMQNLDAIVTNADAFAGTVAQNAPPGSQTLDSTRVAWNNEWELNDSLSLTAITGYYNHDVRVTPVDADEIDVPVITFVEPQKNDTFSQEFRLNGSSAAVDWFVGASYFHEKLAFTTDLAYDEAIVVAILGPDVGLVDTVDGSVCDGDWEDLGLTGLPMCPAVSEIPFGENKTTSVAAYGDMTWHATETVDVTLGARFTRDRKDMYYDNPATAGLLGVLDGQIFGPITDGKVTAKDDWSSLDPRIAVDVALTDDTRIYASAARGYKSGGINRQVNDFLPNPQILNTFNEETNNAYEVGIKSRFADGRAQINAAAFLNDYRDYQLETLVGLVPEVFNVGDIKTRGFEADARFLVTDNLELNGAVAFLNTEVTSSIDPAIIGNETPQAPKTSGFLGFSYNHPVGDGEMEFSGNWQYSSDYWFDIFNTLEQPSYNLVNVRFGYESAEQRWGVAIVGDNISNEEYYTERFLFLDVANRRAPGALWRVEFTANF